MPAPAFAIRLAFGQMGEELLLGGQRVSPASLNGVGFSWRRPDLRAALDFELGAKGPSQG
jgi:NAD dependent epimerase/dehydratase family enzyme